MFRFDYFYYNFLVLGLRRIRFTSRLNQFIIILALFFCYSIVISLISILFSSHYEIEKKKMKNTKTII